MAQMKTVPLGGRGLSKGTLETSPSCLLLGQLWDRLFPVMRCVVQWLVTGGCLG